MNYSLSDAQQLIIETGKELVKTGLVARTWGNISAKLSSTEFLITPSGKSYEDLKPQDLVVVKLEDLSYEGDVKPSSEKGLHAACYKNFAGAGFIIHTHQFYASAISVSGTDFAFAPCIEYGLPGTRKLIKNANNAFASHSDKKQFLMQGHGAICFGDTYEDAYAATKELERNSMKTFFEMCGEKVGVTFVLNDVADDKFIKAAASFNKKLSAYLDDFAQMFGPSVNLDNGIEDICAGEDSAAKKMVLVKNAAASIYAHSIDIDAMGTFDAILQRAVYRFKYSQLKDK